MRLRPGVITGGMRLEGKSRIEEIKNQALEQPQMQGKKKEKSAQKTDQDERAC